MQLETQTQTSSPNPPPPPSPEQGSLEPLNAIRTETVFSRLPLHILSKSGERPQINIEKRTTNGKIEEKWEVSYNEKYGPARQLAYDIHTLIIERAIDEAFNDARRTSQPLPRLIPIDHLREIENKLGLVDGNTNKIKRALFQNAGILVTGYKRYRANDGSDHIIEGVFTPYGIFLYGQKLPDGRKAEQVYVNLNDPYYEAWSTAPTRPLDYDYKALLTPTSRRWYELVSFAMYGALKNNQLTAKLLYSDYCDRAPQLHYFTFDQVKKQMYKVHRPHLQSGYITKIRYDQTTDEQGRLDWIMHYVPGPKARTEYATFGGKKLRTVDAAAEKLGAGESHHPAYRRPRQKPLALRPEQPSVNEQQLTALMSRGIMERAARKILLDLPTDFPVLDSVEWGDFQIAQQPGKITNPPGFYISLLRERNLPPPTFETSRQKAARQAAEFERQQRRQAAVAEATAYEEAEYQKADQLFAQLSPQEQLELESQVKAGLKARHPKVNWDSESAVHEGTIRAGIRRLALERPVPAVSQPASTTAQSPAEQGREEQQPFTPLTQTQLITMLMMLQLPAPSPKF